MRSLVFIAPLLTASACVPDGVEGFACRPDGTCDEGLTCTPLEGRSLLNGRDRDVCLRPQRPPVQLRATTAPCCVDLYLGVDDSGALRMGDPAEQTPLAFRLVNFVDDGITLVTTSQGDVGEADLALCVDDDPAGRVRLCLMDDEVNDVFDEQAAEEGRLQPVPAALWTESPALDGDPSHVSFRSASNRGFLRHSSSDIFAQADTGPPFTQDASWRAEPLDLPPGDGPDEAPNNAPSLVTACGTVLTDAGTRHRLGADLTCPTGDAVTIRGDGIELTFDGFTITTGAGASVIIDNANNVVVRGPGTARGSDNAAIGIRGGGGSRVEGLTLVDNRVGVATIFAPANTAIVDCVITPRSGDGEGIQLIEGAGAGVRRNTVTGGTIGIHIFGQSQGSRLEQSRVSGATFGIVVDEGSGTNTITANTVDAVSTDLTDNNVACGSNTWTGNTFSDAVPANCIR